MTALKFEKHAWIGLALVLLLALGLKLWLVAGEYVPFNADEAIVALMARHILRGARPVFFYGQAYMGSLDAFFIAGAFAVFGEQVWVIRLVQALLYLGVLVTTAWLGREVFGRWRVGVLAALVLSIPTVNVTLYTTASLGGYGEALLIGNLLLIGGLKISKAIRDRHSLETYWWWLIVGFLAGLGLWTFGLTLVYSLPVMIYLLIYLRVWYVRSDETEANTSSFGLGYNRSTQLLKAIASSLVGFLLGSSPWWGYAMGNGFRMLIAELSGSAISGVESVPFLHQVGQHLLNLVVLGGTVTFGLRPPWDITWLGLPLVPFVLAFWIAVCIYIMRFLRKKSTHQSAAWLVVGVMITLIVAFIITPFGADPSGRYFVPLAIPFALFAASMVSSLRARIGNSAYGLVAVLLIFHLWGTIQCARHLPPGITTQFYPPAQVDHRSMESLAEFLQQNGEFTGYSNYWVSYPLAFSSSENLIYVPSLPYHLDLRYTQRDSRYEPYNQVVAEADRVAYITSNNPALDSTLRAGFQDLGVTWEEHTIGDYHVFYEISRKVRPEEIGLGKPSS